MDATIQNTNLYKKLVTILAEEIFGEKADVTKFMPDKDLTNDIGLDDLDAVEMIMSVEDEFDISISDDAAVKISTLRDYYNYLVQNGFDPETCERKKGR